MEIEGEKIGGCKECSVWSNDAGEDIESIRGERPGGVPGGCSLGCLGLLLGLVCYVKENGVSVCLRIVNVLKK